MILAAPAVGKPRDRARAEIEPVQLRKLVAADVLAENETVEIRRRRRGAQIADRFRVERELLAHTQRRAYAMCLCGLGEARGDQEAAIFGPTGKTRRTRVLIAIEL